MLNIIEEKMEIEPSLRKKIEIRKENIKRS